jgi:hypothetical protein
MRLPTDTIRGRDLAGSGYYGASRGGSLGWHGGTDFTGSVGDEVPLPFQGDVVRFGSGYDQGVQVTHPSGDFRVIMAHINSTDMSILAPPFRGMTPHVHFQLEQNLSGQWYRVDPLSVFGR